MAKKRKTLIPTTAEKPKTPEELDEEIEDTRRDFWKSLGVREYEGHKLKTSFDTAEQGATVYLQFKMSRADEKHVREMVKALAKRQRIGWDRAIRNAIVRDYLRLTGNAGH
jgi:hypothetical protein